MNPNVDAVMEPRTMSPDTRPVEIQWMFFCCAAALAASRLAMYHYTQYAIDDAFITYRYARNIASGYGFVFNMGEKVQGTSSPLYTLLLSGVSLLFHSGAIPTASRLIGLMAEIVTLRLLFHMFRNTARAVQILVAAAFILYPKIALFGIEGMEAPVVVALMLGSWQAFQSRRYPLGYVLSALLLLMRIDTILWISLVLMGILYVRHREHMPSPGIFSWKALLAPVLLYGAWVAFCIGYFGSWLPHSVVAKSTSWHHLHSAFEPGHVLAGYLVSHLVTGLPAWAETLILMLLMLPVIVEGIILLRAASPFAIFPVYFILYNTAFACSRTYMTEWYYYPGYAAYLITAGFLLDRIMRFFRIFQHRRLQFALAGSAILVLLVLFRAGIDRWPKELSGVIQRQNEGLGAWLRLNAGSTSHVLLEPIGIIGWESNLYVDDYIGLVSPKVISYRRRTPNSDRWYYEFLKDEQPDFIVQRNWEMPQNKLFDGHADGMFDTPGKREWFTSHYELIDWNPGATDDDPAPFVLYQRISKPLFASLNGGIRP